MYIFVIKDRYIVLIFQKLENWMKKSILSLSAIALASSMLVACNEEEEDLVPKMEPAKAAAEQAAPAAEQPAEQPKADEPELVPIQSLSGNTESSEVAEAEEAPKAFAPAPAGSVQPLSKGEYVIQVSIQSSKRAADGIVKKLAESGIKAYVAEVENPGELEGTYYRIRVGYFESSANAQEYGKQVLTPLNFAWWGDKSKNDDVGNPGGDEYYSTNNYSNSNTDNEPAQAPEPEPAPAPAPEPEPAPAPAPAPEPEPAPAPAPAPEPEPAPAPAPAPEPEPAPAPAPAPEPAPAPAAPAADNFDDWE